MKFNQKEYIKQYQKDNYKMYGFRVKKTDVELIEKLDNLKNRNEYIINSLKNNSNTNGVLSIKDIKSIIKPILNSKEIYNIYLFGSYARGEANADSDVDIYCEHGDIKNLYNVVEINEVLQTALNRKVDIIFEGSKLNQYFEENMKKDLIKLC